jgi:hypothetical protein
LIDFNFDNLAANLPDSYAKDEDSNNYKLLMLCKTAVEIFESAVLDVFKILDIDEATGSTLDLYGERVGQARGTMSDDLYLLMIKARIMRNLNNGSYPSILKSLCMTFSCDAEDVYIGESDEPCRLNNIKLPLDVINSVNMTATQVVEIIKTLLPICITIDEINLAGTFEFSDNENDYNENSGFCDVEDGTIGGYLGYISGDANEPVLPIDDF